MNCRSSFWSTCTKLRNPHFQRVETHLIREFVDRAFQRHETGGRTRRAHIAGGGDRECGKLIGQGDIVAFVGKARPVDDGFW